MRTMFGYKCTAVECELLLDEEGKCAVCDAILRDGDLREARNAANTKDVAAANRPGIGDWWSG